MKNFIDIADPTISDDTLCRREDIGAWLKISLTSLDTWRHRGWVPAPCTPEGARPRWGVGDIRKFFLKKEEPAEKEG